MKTFTTTIKTKVCVPNSSKLVAVHGFECIKFKGKYYMPEISYAEVFPIPSDNKSIAEGGADIPELDFDADFDYSLNISHSSKLSLKL